MRVERPPTAAPPAKPTPADPKRFGEAGPIDPRTPVKAKRGAHTAILMGLRTFAARGLRYETSSHCDGGREVRFSGDCESNSVDRVPAHLNGPGGAKAPPGFSLTLGRD